MSESDPTPTPTSTPAAGSSSRFSSSRTKKVSYPNLLATNRATSASVAAVPPPATP